MTFFGEPFYDANMRAHTENGQIEGPKKLLPVITADDRTHSEDSEITPVGVDSAVFWRLKTKSEKKLRKVADNDKKFVFENNRILAQNDTLRIQYHAEDCKQRNQYHAEDCKQRNDNAAKDMTQRNEIDARRVENDAQNTANNAKFHNFLEQVLLPHVTNNNAITNVVSTTVAEESAVATRSKLACEQKILIKKDHRTYPGHTGKITKVCPKKVKVEVYKDGNVIAEGKMLNVDDFTFIDGN